MKLPIFLTGKALPWTLVGVASVYILFSFSPFNASCSAKESKYYVSPQGNHAARHFYEDCGGATVGFTQVVDLDGIEIFTTYEGGKDNAVVKWASDKVLQIEYPLTLYNVREFEPWVGDVEVQLIHKGELVTEQMILDARDDY